MSAVDQYKAQALKQLDLIDAKLLENEYIQVISAKVQSKVPQARPSFLALGAGLFVLLFLVWGVGARFVTNLVGFAYPLYQSFETLKEKKADERDSQWLTYWIVYCVFTLVESLTNFLQNWIPLYHLVKVLFLAWCFLPQTRGAAIIYKTIIEPVLVRYEGQIDVAEAKGEAAARRVVADVEAEVEQEISHINKSIVDSAINNALSGAHGGPEAVPSEPKKDQ